MPQLNLKPNHKAVRDYYATLQQYDQHDIRHEGAVSNPFAFLLDACAKQADATLVPQYAMRTPKGNRIVLDGVVLDAYGLPFAYWEVKDMASLPRCITIGWAIGQRWNGLWINIALRQTNGVGL